MIIITFSNKGFTFFLRGTAWAGSYERAEKFPSKEAALKAAEKARQFMKPRAFKKIVYTEI